ncbi:MAG: acetyl-CoA carboxylase biotin carboxyl carrier protein subunit [Bacteroidetes bacterium]|nr:acetyl-CoA carboxylase biotin carboxyl carrier protein subunit [Bacteroidota bacterium]
MKAIINSKEIKIEKKEEGVFLVNGNEEKLDIADFGNDAFHALHQNKSYRTRIIEHDTTSKTFKIKVNNNVYTVQLKDRYDELLHALGMDTLLNNKVNDLKAPMPGLVLNVLVEEGTEIKKGDNLVVLEAMKMENILKATADAKVKKIKVSKGNRVEKNEVLIELG